MDQQGEGTSARREVADVPAPACRGDASDRPACPVCGGRLVEIRAKFQCAQCHRICETCCEGGRG